MKAMARFVLMGDVLLPGGYQLGDERLRGVPLMVEVRRRRGDPLPLEVLRALREDAAALLVDGGSVDHREVVDLLLVEADRACINSEASSQERQLAHALSPKVMTRLLLAPPSLEEDALTAWVEDHLAPHLREVANDVGRDLLVVSQGAGALAAVWALLPADVIRAFDWWLAPAEGAPVELADRPATPRGWMLDGEHLVEGRS